MFRCMLCACFGLLTCAAVVNYWKEYQNLVISKDSQDDEDDGEVLLDLPEGALETNLGIPIIIVVTKVCCP